MVATSLVSFGARNEDGTVSDGGRERAIQLHEEFSSTGKIDLPFPCLPKSEPNPYHNVNLRDKEQYPAWHSRWIDGVYKSVLETLDGMPNFMVPIFDPTGVAAKLGLPIPDVDLQTIIGSFAVPPASLPMLLNIGIDDIPSFLSKLPTLIQPPVPVIPKLPELPTLPDKPGLPAGQILFGGFGVPGYPSLEGFNLALFMNMPKMFTGLLQEIAKPDWWLSFTPAKLFETSCKVVHGLMPPASTSTPTNYTANTSMITVLTSEALAARAAGEIVGATTLLKIMGEKKGYLTQSTPPTSLDGEAALNNLYRLQSNGKNMAVLFPQRNFSYGDQFTIDTIQNLANHMFEDTSYRKDPSEEPLTLEVGNITGKQWQGNAGWRHNPWSASHGGTSFDSAYPMRNSEGNWITGVGDNKVVDGIEEGSTATSPFRCGVKGNAGVPYKEKGKLAHDFPAMYEMARWLFCDWMPQIIKEGRMLPWTENGPKVVPYRTILIGRKIHESFSTWAFKKYGVDWNNPHVKLYPKGWSLMSHQMFTPWGPPEPGEGTHEDHMHWAGQRTKVDVELSKGDILVYRCHHLIESVFRYEKKKIEIDDGKTYNARI